MSFNFRWKRFPLTLASLACAFVFIVVDIVWDADLFEKITGLIALGEAFELDELIIPVIFIVVGLSADFYKTTMEDLREAEKLKVYHHMNEEMMAEISTHLAKLIEFRNLLIKHGPHSNEVRNELDRMIVRSFNHYERAQSRGDVDSSMMPLVVPGIDEIEEKLQGK